MPPAVVAPPAADFDYDVFVSYHEADQRWVDEELLRQLRGADLEVTGDWDFDVGEDMLAARELRVRKSRHTLVILTPEWCESHLTGADGQLVQYLDPAATDRRLLPLVLKECRLPERINQLVKADFTDPAPERREAAMNRLLKGLERPRAAIDKALAQKARRGLAALAELVGAAEVREIVWGVKESLDKACEDIEELRRWKKVHDLLHEVAVPFPQLMGKKNELAKAEESRAEGEGAGGDELWLGLKHLVGTQLEPTLDLLIDYLRGGDVPAKQVPWVSVVATGSDSLRRAAGEEDLKLLKRGVELLGLVIGQQMNSVNQKLFVTAGRLPLDNLVKKFRSIGQELGRLEFNEEAAARVGEFRKGIPALEELHARLQVLVNNHNCLQTVEDQLRHLDPLSVALEELEVYWSLVAAPLDMLQAERGNTWVGELRDKRGELDGALPAGKEAGAAAKAARKVRFCFIDFQGKLTTGFVRLDKALLRFCDELKTVGDSLRSALQEMGRD
jgi:hypothetical protein